MDKLHRISPSTSVATLNFSGTPKRSVIPKRPGTPLHVINEEKDNASAENRCTPVIRNPFDIKAEALYLPACSPSVFATLQQNKTDNGSFRWSIEHLSVLYPADIDETSIPETWVDAEQELNAQKAIDAFFSQNKIVPSPWSSSPKEGKINAASRRRVNLMFEDIQQQSEATTQTTLSIPPSVDLSEILDKYFTYNEDANQNISSKENSHESLSDSSTSLRRRLFAEDEGFSTPIKNFRATKIWTTPIRMQNAYGTPASDVLSSSPITPPNCSDSCNVLTSPPISPIKANISATDGKIITSNNDEETESSSNSPMEHRGESFMSFCVESQDTNPFPSYVSERQDTGYATGSINSFGNMTSETNFGFVSRITPVTELMEECELSNSASCDISYKMDCASMGVTSVDCRTGILSNTCNLKTYPWVPTCCSTPAQCSHSQPMTD